tara:strand:- start:238 stop:963 length:726 start_codon:yes stop_codon:yes gene_type:complete
MTDLAKIENSNELAFLHDSKAFEHLFRVAKAFSMSQVVPAHFQGKPENCMTALMMSQQLKVNPLLCLQNMHFIHGNASFSASFSIALANERGPFVGPLTWDVSGKDQSLSVTCKAVLKATGEVVSTTVDMATATKAGWTKNQMYKTMPAQMLRYRSATWLIRLYCPEVLCGLQSMDEIIDISPIKQSTKVDSGMSTEVDPTMKSSKTDVSDSVIDSINATISESVRDDSSDSDKKNKEDIF